MSENKIAIVTGANKGLGFSIVKLLCKKYNGKVYLTSRDDKRGIKAYEELKKKGFNPIYQQLDVTDNESVKRFMKIIQDKNEKVEILFNNAGIYFINSPEPKIYQAEETILVNVTSLINFTEMLIPFLSTNAKIVNITSSSGHLSRIPSQEIRDLFSPPNLTLSELQNIVEIYVEDVKRDEEIQKGWGSNPYIVSKVAVNAYTFNLHRRLSPKGITVTCVHPGYVISDMTFGNGNINPEDAAILPVTVALEGTVRGRFVWHNGQDVQWDGADPRGYIDGKDV